MEYSYSIQPVKRTVVDIPATSRLLKDLRNKNGFSVKQLQDDVTHSIGKKFQLYKD